VALYSGFRNLNTDFESPLISTKADILVSGLISNYYLNYYPNSRTSYSGNAGIIYEFGNGTEESVVEDTKYRNLRTYVSLSSTYYFSPQLTLNGSAGFSYNHLNNNSSFYSIATYPIQNSGNLYLSFSLKYKMF